MPTHPVVSALFFCPEAIMIEKTLYLMLSKLGISLFPVIAPMEQTKPWVSYRRLRTKPTVTVKGTNPKHDNADFEISVFSQDYLTAAELGEQIIESMDADWGANSVLLENRDEPYDPNTGTYQRLLIFALREIKEEGGS